MSPNGAPRAVWVARATRSVGELRCVLAIDLNFANSAAARTCAALAHFSLALALSTPRNLPLLLLLLHDFSFFFWLAAISDVIAFECLGKERKKEKPGGQTFCHHLS